MRKIGPRVGQKVNKRNGDVKHIKNKNRFLSSQEDVNKRKRAFVCACLYVGVISFHLFGSLPELATKSTIMFF